MAMLDFGTVRCCSLVADKQKNVYVNACSGGVRVFAWQGCTKGAVSIRVIPRTCSKEGLAKLLKLFKSHKFAGQKKVFPHFKRIISGYFAGSISKWILSIS